MYNKLAASNKNTDESEQLTLNIEDLSINDDDDTDTVTTCANCDKEVINPNTCNKCKAATYCNASCKKKHRKQHKKKCEIRAAELHDIGLFNQPPPNEDCPICMLPIPTTNDGFWNKIP